MEKEYDFVVVGGGSAGYAAARTAREWTDKVAVIDGGEELSGLCILRGCMPSKTLLYVAEIMHLAKNADKFGLKIPEVSADMKAVAERKKQVIAEFADYRKGQLESGRFDLYRSHAKFTDSHTLELADGTIIKSPRILISTGSSVNVPSVPGLKDTPFWTSDDVLELDFVPDSVIVLGGGIVACELAQYLNRIGTRVIQIQRSGQVLKELPTEAAAVVEKAFRDEGIELYTETEITSIKKKHSGVEVCFEHEGKSVQVTGTYLFNALGRHPNVKSLALEKVGVKTQVSGHIEIDEYQQTSVPGIYAAGDCSGPVEIVHIAVLQGENAAKHAFSKPVEPVNYDHLTTVVFTDPQVATAGMSEDLLKMRGIDYIVDSYPFDDHGKSILMEAKYGYVKVMAEKSTGRILGAECVGKDAGELIHPLAIAVSANLTAAQLLKTHWYHPTLAEIWTYPIEEIADQVKATL